MSIIHYPLSIAFMSNWGKKDRQYIWHPFTQMKEWEETDPTIIVEGKGVFLKDIQGKRYILSLIHI